MVTELAHTHDNALCLACEVDHVRDGIATVSLADAKRAHAALRQLYAALAIQQARIAELEAERGHLEEGVRLLKASDELGLFHESAYGAALDRWLEEDAKLEAERARKAKG